MKQKSIKPTEIGPYVKRTIAHASSLGERGRHDEALRVAYGLYQQFPERADANDALSLAFLDVKRNSEALKYARKAAELEPKALAYKVNLGLLYLELGKAEDALPLLERAAESRDCGVEALWALARYYHEVGQADMSFPYFERATKVADRSGDLPQIRFDFARSLASSGQIDQAEQLAALLQGDAAWRDQAIVFSASLRRHDIGSEMYGELMRIVSSSSASDAVKAQAYIQLGKIQDQGGEYGKAFASFSQSKTLRNVEFDMDAFAQQVESLISVFDSDVFNRFAHVGQQSDVPVFVVGMPRSGTTLTEQIIAAHPEAAGIGEQSRIGAFAKHLVPEAEPGRVLLALQNASAGSWQEIGAAYIRLVHHLKPEAKRVVDKMPHNFLHVGLIALCLPKAKIVHVHRNPLDNFMSAFENHMTDYHSYSFEQSSYGKYYLLYERLMRHWNSVLPGRIFDCSYEELVTAPEAKVRAMLDYIGLPWDEGCLKFHEKKSTVRTFSLHQVRNPISSKSVGRWQRYAAELGTIRGILSR